VVERQPSDILVNSGLIRRNLPALYHPDLTIHIMSKALPRVTAPGNPSVTAPFVPQLAAFIVIGSIVLGAVLFRTHTYEVTPFAWEVVRHFSIFFMACELVVVWLALRTGLNVAEAWRKLAVSDRAALALWLLTFWVGSALSEQPGYSLIVAISWPIHLLFGLAIWHHTGRASLTTEYINRSLGRGIAFALMGMLGLTAAHFVNAPEPTSLPGGQVFWQGAIPGFLSVRLFGVVMAYAALFGAGMLMVDGGRGRAKLAVALLLLGFGALCWSSTRAAVPAFFSALLILPLIVKCRPSPGVWLTIGVTILAAFLLSTLVPAPSQDYGAFAVFGGDVAAAGDVTAGRIDMWRAALGAIAERPLIGHGEGSMRWLLDQNTGIHVQPHNVLLQLFLHWGALAACAAMWLAGRMLLTMIAAVQRDHALLPYAMVVVAAAIAALFDGALYYPQMVMLPVAALAFVLGRSASPSPPQPIPSALAH
jgi:exopolysaccharide production protein ExoQ